MIVNRDCSANTIVFLQDLDARIAYLEEIDNFNRKCTRLGQMLRPYFTLIPERFWCQYAVMEEHIRAVILDVSTDAVWSPQALLFDFQSRKPVHCRCPVIMNSFDQKAVVYEELHCGLYYSESGAPAPVTFLQSRPFMNDLSRILHHRLILEG